MKIYKTQAEVDADINVAGDLIVDDDVMFVCDVTVGGSIHARDINAGDIHAGGIHAWSINAWCIHAENINAGHVHAENITAGHVHAGHITARDIHAWSINAWCIHGENINAGDIHAGDISYHAVCVASKSFQCRSVKGRRENSRDFCLDSEIVLKGASNEPNP